MTQYVSNLQASSDLSILDFDIPFTTIFVTSEIAELLTMIGIMVSVTWQVLIVAVLAMVASKYVQVIFFLALLKCSNDCFVILPVLFFG